MEQLSLAIRRAGRRLLRSPGFLLPATATLALGIGTITSVFTLVDAVLLKPLPYPEADQLVSIRHSAPGLRMEITGISAGAYFHYRARAGGLTSVGAYTQHDAVTATDGDDAERLHIAMVTPSVFTALRVTPMLGRLFTEAEGAPGAATVVIISHDLWARRYGSDSSLIGKQIGLNHILFEVVGVMPAGFGFPREDTQVWYNLSLNPSRARVADFGLHAVARLKPDVTPSAAEGSLRSLIPALAGEYSDATADWLRRAQLRVHVSSLKSIVVGDVRQSLIVLACTAVFVVLIACANVASLVVVRAEHHRRDVAVERALGAANADVVRRLLSEGLMIAVLGGLAGLAISYAAVAVHFGLTVDQLPRLREVRLDPRIALSAVGAAVGVGLALAAIGYARAGRPQLATMLREVATRATIGPGWQRALRVLVSLQIALALCLLIGCALMVQSAWRLSRADVGFRLQPAIVFQLSLPYDPYPTYTASARFYTELTERLRRINGVTSAEAVGVLPLTPIAASAKEAVVLADSTTLPTDVPGTASVSFATSGYFRAMRVPLKGGRPFAPGDLASPANPVIVSQTLARALAGNGDVIGKRLRFAKHPRYNPFTVVGIVGSVPTDAIADGPTSALYFPVVDDGPRGSRADSTMLYVPGELNVVVHSSLPPPALIPQVRAILRQLDRRVPLGRVRTVDQLVAASTARTRLTALTLIVAAATACFLGLVGIYGIVAYTVAQRVPEFGLRLALGATPADIVQLVMRQAAVVALVGVALGLVTGAGLAHFLRSLLFSIGPSDPLTLVGTSALLLGIAVVASYPPARRAGRVDPITALKAG